MMAWRGKKTMTGHNSTPELIDRAKSAAVKLNGSKADVFESGMELGRALYKLEDIWTEAKGSGLSKPGLNKRREEAGLSPESLGIRSPDLSNWAYLARYEEALMCFLVHWQGMKPDELEECLRSENHFGHAQNEFVPTVADPNRLRKNWRTAARRLRKAAAGRAYQAKFFPGMGYSAILKLMGKPDPLEPEEIHKIQSLARQAEDREGTPEGETFRSKAEALAEAHGYDLSEVEDMVSGYMSPSERQRLHREMSRKILVRLADEREVYSKALADWLLQEGHDDLQSFVAALKERYDDA